MTLMTEVRHLTTAELEAGVETIRQSPKDHGVIDLIVIVERGDERDDDAV